MAHAYAPNFANLHLDIMIARLHLKLYPINHFVTSSGYYS